MKRSTENKTILVTRKTRLEELVAKYNTVSQAKFYVEHLGADFSDYVNEHETYQRCIREAETSLQQFCRVQIVDRSFLPNFLFGPRDTVVALGQDGLVANTLKYLDGQPLVGVNPDPNAERLAELDRELRGPALHGQRHLRDHLRVVVLVAV